jgi:hypothetical protein
MTFSTSRKIVIERLAEYYVSNGWARTRYEGELLVAQYPDKQLKEEYSEKLCAETTNPMGYVFPDEIYFEDEIIPPYRLGERQVRDTEDGGRSRRKKASSFAVIGKQCKQILSGEDLFGPRGGNYTTISSKPICPKARPRNQ